MTTLSDELANDPMGLGYAQWLPNSPGMVVQLINAPSFAMVKSLMMSERGILAQYPDGPVAADAVLTKLDTFAQTQQALASVVRRALRFLGDPEGIDMGSPATQSMLDAVQQAGVLTADETTKLKALAMQPASRAEVLGLGVVTEAQVVEAA